MAAVGSERISEEFAGHGFRNCRMVVGARAQAGCTCAEEDDRKGAGCSSIYFVVFLVAGWVIPTGVWSTGVFPGDISGLGGFQEEPIV